MENDRVRLDSDVGPSLSAVGSETLGMYIMIHTQLVVLRRTSEISGAETHHVVDLRGVRISDFVGMRRERGRIQPTHRNSPNIRKTWEGNKIYMGWAALGCGKIDPPHVAPTEVQSQLFTHHAVNLLLEFF